MERLVAAREDEIAPGEPAPALHSRYFPAVSGRTVAGDVLPRRPFLRARASGVRLHPGDGRRDGVFRLAPAAGPATI
jgi:hypothetical protein